MGRIRWFPVTPSFVPSFVLATSVFTFRPVSPSMQGVAVPPSVRAVA